LNDISLFCIRNKQKQETDFLVVGNDFPRLLVESKLTDDPIERYHLENVNALHNIPFAQVCLGPGIASMQKRDAYRRSPCRRITQGHLNFRYVGKAVRGNAMFVNPALAGEIRPSGMKWGSCGNVSYGGIRNPSHHRKGARRKLFT
jgi:hypothetical protein